MIVVISHHWCKPGMDETARGRIDKSGDTMEAAPGFMFRYRIEPSADPNQVSTMTVWADEQSYRAYRDTRRAPDPADPSVPYARVTTEIFDVRRVHGQSKA
jgi:heme-degrading monooxygenase HmoA